jgi:hypothetical protein
MVLTTSKGNRPHSIFVICKGVVDGKILINVCQMRASLANIRENPLVSLALKRDGRYYSIEGKAALHSEGKYFDLAVERNVDENKPKYALLVEIRKVFDSNKAQQLYP